MRGIISCGQRADFCVHRLDGVHGNGDYFVYDDLSGQLVGSAHNDKARHLVDLLVYI